MTSSSPRTRAAALIACLLLGACLPRGRFRCEDDRQCVAPAGGARGFCEAAGVCSFEDASCELGRRYAAYADEAGALAGRCVDSRPCASTPVIDVRAGGAHACLRRLDGRVFCWGRNDAGQLGDGTLIPRATPVAVVGLPGPVRALAAGARLSCAIDQDGRVFCWGDGGAGQLGPGFEPGARSLRPVEVAGVTGALELAVGAAFVCARTLGGVVCWGDAVSGQRAPAPSAPGAVSLPGTAEQIVAGARHACARLGDGGVACWGEGARGALGTGDAEPRPAPARVPALADVVELAAGAAHTCARLRAGGVVCWGDNRSGQLGQPASPPRLAPAPLPGSETATRLRLGAAHTCLVLADETAACTGENARSELGLPAGEALAPGLARVLGVSGVLELAAGDHFACALARDTSVRCWGADGHGQLGSGGAIFRATPSPLPVARGVTAVAAGGAFSCFVRAGQVACFGAGDEGALGPDAAAGSSLPLPLAIPADVAALAAGEAGACARTIDRELVCWGRGVGEVPRLRTGVTAVEEVAHGRAHVCVRSRGRVLCWGENRHGQLGQAPGPDVTRPEVVPLAAPAAELALGDDFTCARFESGSVTCFGRGSEGQLGNGRLVESATPVLVALAAPARALAAGRAHACAILADATIACWGRGAEGQLGSALPMPTGRPIAVPALAGATALAAGADFTCALAGSSLHCFGASSVGQLGPGTIDAQPRQVPLAHSPKLLAAGAQHVCIVDQDNDMRCFGLDASGQLGTGRPLESARPRPVALACP